MRSLLFVPADDEKKLGKGADTGADALILDLEDSVSLPRKSAARVLAAQYLAAARSREAGPLLYVRVNAMETDLWQHDVAGVVAARPHGILLPKAGSGEDVHKLSIALHHEEERAGVAAGSTRIVAIATETPLSLLQLQTYVGASARLEGLTWGAEDLSAELGARSNREDDGRTWTSPYRLARDLTLFAAAAAKVQAIDTVFVNFRDSDGLRQECRAAVRDGFTGKMAIHPGQVAVINEAFTPTPEEIALSEEIVQAFAAAPEAGVLGIRGHMVDRPHLARAERILARAKAAGRR
jgi:citrate lyase subunit beta/citryl-CoA lyase